VYDRATVARPCIASDTHTTYCSV